MNRDAMMEAVRRQMSERRWAHTVGVMETAVRLAERFGGDPVKADQAALLHDYTKYWPVEKLRQIIVEERLPQDLLEHEASLWHAPVGAVMARRDFGIEDEEVLDAIRYHTSGREGMTLLDKIICLADYVEPGRDFPGVHQIRELAEYSLEKALVAGFDSTIQFLISKGKRIFPLTVLARNALIRELGG